METENLRDEIEIDIGELLKAVLSKLILIIFVGVLVGTAFFAYSKFYVKPQYTSSTKVYILNKPETNSLTTNDLAFATYIAKDYQILIVSDPVLKEVINELELNMTTKTLASSISLTLLSDSRVIQIDVRADSPQLAKSIADTLRDVANVKTKDVMGGIEAINAVDEASLPVVPSSPNILKNTAIGFAAGAGIVLFIVIILFILDDSIKTPEDIEKYLGISVLASIPMEKGSSSSKKKKKKSKAKKED